MTTDREHAAVLRQLLEVAITKQINGQGRAAIERAIELLEREAEAAEEAEIERRHPNPWPPRAETEIYP